MSHPIVIAHHLIWTAYCCWLANDPRGSMSHTIASDIIAELGHLLIRKHRHQAEEMIENLQSSSRLWLRTSRLRADDHPVWGAPGWKVFLDSPDAVRRTICYIEENSVKWHLPRQSWPFVREYDGWPFHAGYSPNSPYAKRLRELRNYNQ
jgi:hypothetical protein